MFPALAQRSPLGGLRHGKYTLINVCVETLMNFIEATLCMPST